MIDPRLIQAILSKLDELKNQGTSFVASERFKELGSKNVMLEHLLYMKHEGWIKGDEVRTGVGGINLERMVFIELTNSGRKHLQPELETAEADRAEAVTPHESEPTGPTKVFVVHGRNLKARDGLFQFLRSIGLKPIEWSQAIVATGKTAPYIGEILDAAFSKAQAVVVLLTPDDAAYLRERLRGQNEPPYETQATPQARPNVLFEAGMALGRHPDRTILLELGHLRPFSDVAGRHAIRINNSTERRQDLAERLQLAGCPVDLSGRDWHTAGDFDAALEGL